MLSTTINIETATLVLKSFILYLYLNLIFIIFINYDIKKILNFESIA